MTAQVCFSPSLCKRIEQFCAVLSGFEFSLALVRGVSGGTVRRLQLLLWRKKQPRRIDFISSCITDSPARKTPVSSRISHEQLGDARFEACKFAIRLTRTLFTRKADCAYICSSAGNQLHMHNSLMRTGCRSRAYPCMKAHPA